VHPDAELATNDVVVIAGLDFARFAELTYITSYVSEGECRYVRSSVLMLLIQLLQQTPLAWLWHKRGRKKKGESQTHFCSSLIYAPRRWGVVVIASGGGEYSCDLVE
jgi:hypothetical protein